MRRAIQIALAALVAGLAVLAAAVLILPRTDVGQGWLARVVGELASTPTMTVTIGRLGGALPDHVTAWEIAVADAGGVWLTFDQVALDWEILPLIRHRLHIRNARAQGVTIVRLPASSAPAGASAAPLAPPKIELPRLPLDIAVDRLTVDLIRLEAAVLGQPATLKVDAQASVEQGWHDLRLELAADRRDAPGSAHLTLHTPPGASNIMASLTYTEPAGGLAAALAGLPGGPPVSLSLDGAVDGTAWRGRLVGRAEGLADLDAVVTVESGDRTTLALQGKTNLAALAPDSVRPFLDQGVTIDTGVSWSADGQIAVDHMTLGVPAITLTTQGRAFPDLDLTAHIAAPSLAPFAVLAGTPVNGAVTLDAHIQGDPSAPTVDADAIGANLAIANETAEQARLHAHVMAQPDGWQIASTGMLSGLVVPGAEPVQRLSWDAGTTVAGAILQIDHAHFDADLAQADGHGRYGLEDGWLDVVASLDASDLGALSAFAGRPLAGSGHLETTVKGSFADRLAVTLQGRLDQLKLGVPAIEALLGGHVQTDIVAERQADGLLQIDRLSLAGENLQLTGTGRVVEGRAITRATVAIDRLAPFSSIAGTPLDGKLTVEATIDAGVADQTGEVTLTGTVNGLAPRLVGRFALQGQQLAIDGLRADLAGATLDGNLRLDLDRRTAAGKLRLAAADLSPWSKLAGEPIGGRLSADVGLASTSGGQSAMLNVDATDISAAGQHLGSLHGKATATDLLGKTAKVDAHVDIAALDSGGKRIDRATVAATGPATNLAVKVDASGSIPGPAQPQAIRLDAAGNINVSGAHNEATLRTLTAQLGTLPIRLQQTLHATSGPDEVRVDRANFTIGSGHVAVEARLGQRIVDGTVAVAGLPLDQLSVLAPGLPMSGTLDIDARLSGSPAKPRLGAKATLRSHGLTIALDATSDGERISAHGRIDGAGPEPVVASAELPAHLTVLPVAFTLPGSATLNGRVTGTVDLKTLLAIAEVDQDASGLAHIDLRLGGTAGNPDAAGFVELANGRYDDPVSGLHLEQIQARLTGERARLTLTRLEATDGGTGRLTGRGGIDLAAGGTPLGFEISLQQFHFVHPQVDAHADAALTVGGTLIAPRASGTVTVTQADATIPEQLPVTLVKIPVKEINRPASASSRSSAAASPPVTIALAVTVNGAGRIAVRGRGIDSEWRGKLSVGGTSANPEIMGGLTLVRGRLDILGKQLTLTDGRIDFPGGSEPFITVVATSQASDLQATITLSGPASRLAITLTSTPALPQDEILARVLFGSTTAQLTAGQAVQLASAIASLTGNGGSGLIDRIRRATGLDVLTISQIQTSKGTKTSALSVGKYLTDNIYVSTNQGLTPESRNVGVQIDLTHNLSVTTQVGLSKDNSIGLNWKMDY